MSEEQEEEMVARELGALRAQVEAQAARIARQVAKLERAGRLVSRLRAAFLDATRLIPVNTVVELEADTLMLVMELAPRLGTSWGVAPPIAGETRQETAP